MNLLDVVFIGLGLSMDAAAVSMTNSMVYKKSRKRLWLMPLFFGAFQAFMPLIGYYAGGLFAEYIQKYAGIVAFIILGFIGVNMVREAVKCKDGACEVGQILTIKSIIAQAIATSIDAFAVGVSFSIGGLSLNILLTVGIIGITTALCSILAIILGKKFGDTLEGKAEIFGGIILILIGIKSLLGI